MAWQFDIGEKTKGEMLQKAIKALLSVIVHAFIRVWLGVWIWVGITVVTSLERRGREGWENTFLYSSGPCCCYGANCEQQNCD